MDNYYKLIAAEITAADIRAKSKLKVYKGTTLISEQGLPGIPSAVASFYIDNNVPKVPGKKNVYIKFGDVCCEAKIKEIILRSKLSEG